MTVGRLSWTRRKGGVTAVWRCSKKDRGRPFVPSKVSRVDLGRGYVRLATFPNTSGWVLDLVARR